MTAGGRRGPSPDPGRQARVPRHDQVRALRGTPFAWLDARLLRGGWLRALSLEELSVYVFLCLAGDRQGVSYYRRARIGQELGLDDQQVHRALARLREVGLVAYAPFHPGAPDGFHQVLPLPARAPGPWSLLNDLAARLGHGPGAREPRE